MATSARAAQPHIDVFAKSYDFPLDDFQVRACEAVALGQGVLLAADAPQQPQPLRSRTTP